MRAQHVEEGSMPEKKMMLGARHAKRKGRPYDSSGSIRQRTNGASGTRQAPCRISNPGHCHRPFEGGETRGEAALSRFESGFIGFFRGGGISRRNSQDRITRNRPSMRNPAPCCDRRDYYRGGGEGSSVRRCFASAWAANSCPRSFQWLPSAPNTSSPRASAS